MEVRLYQRTGELLLGSNYDGQFDMFGEGEAELKMFRISLRVNKMRNE